MTDLSHLETQISEGLAAVRDLTQLEALRLEYMGKQGAIPALLKTLGSMTPDERKEQGPLINGLRDRVAALLSERKATLEGAALDAKLAAERVDLTPPRRPAARVRSIPPYR